MKTMNFEKISEKCPWLYQPYSYSSKLCKAASRERFAAQHQDHYKPTELWAGNTSCSRKNCAIYFWLKQERKHQK